VIICPPRHSGLACSALPAALLALLSFLAFKLGKQRAKRKRLQLLASGSGKATPLGSKDGGPSLPNLPGKPPSSPPSPGIHTPLAPALHGQPTPGSYSPALWGTDAIMPPQSPFSEQADGAGYGYNTPRLAGSGHAVPCCAVLWHAVLGLLSRIAALPSAPRFTQHRHRRWGCWHCSPAQFPFSQQCKHRPVLSSCREVPAATHR